MVAAEEKAKALIAKRSLTDLINDFELTETVNDPSISIVRGWIMDELEKRNPEAFEKWIDAYSESPRAFFIK